MVQPYSPLPRHRGGMHGGSRRIIIPKRHSRSMSCGWLRPAGGRAARNGGPIQGVAMGRLCFMGMAITVKMPSTRATTSVYMPILKFPVRS